MRTNSTIEIAIPDGVWSVDRETSEIGFHVKVKWRLQAMLTLKPEPEER